MLSEGSDVERAKSVVPSSVNTGNSSPSNANQFWKKVGAM